MVRGEGVMGIRISNPFLIGVTLNPIAYYLTQNWALVNPMNLVIIHSLLNGNTGNSGDFFKKNWQLQKNQFSLIILL